jgi:hypothetical protein
MLVPDNFEKGLRFLGLTRKGVLGGGNGKGYDDGRRYVSHPAC